MDVLDAATLLRTARLRAGLTQRALARRAGTSQSVVARIESGHTDPGVETLRGLLEAAGFVARCTLLRVASLGRGVGSG